MKTMFIEANYDGKVVLPDDAIRRMPAKTGLFASVQFIRTLPDIKLQLEKKGKNVRLFKPEHAKYKGQLLGCSIKKFPGVDAFLYIGDGMFHPIALAIENKRPVFIYNPFSKQLQKLSQDAVELQRRRQDAALKKFYMSNNIGILVSTKPGQNLIKEALRLKQKLKKNCYILIANDINLRGLENYPFIDCFVNTACPRISYDDYQDIKRPIIDIGQIRH